MSTTRFVVALLGAGLMHCAPLSAQFSPPPPTVIPDTTRDDAENPAPPGPVRLSPPLAVTIRQKSGGLVRGRLTEVNGEAVVVNTERQQGLSIKLSAIRNLRTADGELQWQSDKDQPSALLAAARRLAGATASVGAPAAAGEPPTATERARPPSTDLFEGRPVSSAPLPSSPSTPVTTFNQNPPSEPPRDLFESQPVSSGVPIPAQAPAAAAADPSTTPAPTEDAAAPAAPTDEIRISASALRTGVTIFVAVLAALAIAAAVLWRMNAAPAQPKPARKRPRVKG